MQGFGASRPARALSTARVDPSATVVLPALHPLPVSSEPIPRVPLLPDNYGAYHASLSDAADLSARPGTILATNPENVIPGAPLAEVEPVTIDGIELKFAHEPAPVHDVDTGSTIIRDLWRGMVEDVIGGTPKKAI